MLKLFLVIIMTCYSISSCSVKQDENTILENLLDASSGLVSSIMEKNCSKHIDFLKDEFVSKLEENDNACNILNRYYDSMNSANRTLKNINVKICQNCFENSIFLKKNSYVYAMVDFKFEINHYDQITESAYVKKMIAESDNHGKSWKFIDLSAVKEPDLDEFFPEADHSVLAQFLK